MLRWCIFSCPSTHMSCYASVSSLALPHIRHATLVYLLLHFHTYVMSSKVFDFNGCHKNLPFFEVKCSKMSKIGEHYVVLCSLKHIDMMQKCEKLQEIEIGHWYYECGSYTTARPLISAVTFIPLVPHVMVVSCQATGTSQHSGHGRELRTEIQVVFLVADASASASALSGPYMEKYI